MMTRSDERGETNYGLGLLICFGLGFSRMISKPILKAFVTTSIIWDLLKRDNLNLDLGLEAALGLTLDLAVTLGKILSHIPYIFIYILVMFLVLQIAKWHPHLMVAKLQCPEILSRREHLQMAIAILGLGRIDWSKLQL